MMQVRSAISETSSRVHRPLLAQRPPFVLRFPLSTFLCPIPTGYCLLLTGYCLLLLGCHTRDYEVAPVSGRITLDQKPVEGIHVSFQPEAAGKEALNPGPGSFGVTDAEGRYRLELVEPRRSGAVIGTHRVRFALLSENAAIDDVGGPFRSRLPSKYRDGSVTFTVPPEGTDQANFDLVSQP